MKIGVVEKELSTFSLSDGTEYTIELNKGGVVHIHFDNARLDLTVSEFEEYISVIEEAREKLKEEKNE